MPASQIDSSHGPAHTLFPVFQSSGTPFFNNGRLIPGLLVEEMGRMLLHGYHDVQHAVFTYMPNLAPTIAAPVLLDLESQHGNHQQVISNGHGRVTPSHPLPVVNSHFTSEPDDSAREGGHWAPHIESDSHGDSLILPKRTGVWMSTFVVAFLSLIVVPGLVVGVMTGQMSWGVELSGAIAPLVSLLAGLYYHTKK